MTSTTSFALFSLLLFFVPFRLRCLTSMKQCLAGRIRQDRDRKERKGKRKLVRPKDSESEAGIKTSQIPGGKHGANKSEL